MKKLLTLFLTLLLFACEGFCSPAHECPKTSQSSQYEKVIPISKPKPSLSLTREIKSSDLQWEEFSEDKVPKSVYKLIHTKILDTFAANSNERPEDFGYDSKDKEDMKRFKSKPNYEYDAEISFIDLNQDGANEIIITTSSMKNNQHNIYQYKNRKWYEIALISGGFIFHRQFSDDIDKRKYDYLYPAITEFHDGGTGNMSQSIMMFNKNKNSYSNISSQFVPQTILFSEYFKGLMRELFNYCPGKSVNL